MKQLKQLLALVLALALCFTLAAPACASDAGDTSDFIEEMEEIPLEEEPVEEESAPEETPVPAGTVTGFAELTDNEISASGKPTLDELTALMPETLTVYLESGEAAEIPVSWYCLDDYEASDDYYFQFSPTWDTATWPVSDSIDVELDAPYMAVCLSNLEVSEDGTIAISSEPPVLYGSLDAIACDGVITRSASSNKGVIFNFLTGNMGLTSAAACGIMANIYAECSFIETAVGPDGSYGLCQWLGSRKTRLISWCKENGYNYKTVEGQMNYLSYEVQKYYPSVYSYIRKCSNTAQGAYDAGYYWCAHYEIPANTTQRSVTRGNLAKNTFWPQYGATTAKTPTISGASTPASTMKQGTGMSIYGTISSSQKLTSVTAGIYNSSNKLVSGKTVKPNSTTYNLNALDNDILFSSLSAGSYVYRVTATVSSGTYTLLESSFKVTGTSSPSTVAKVSGMTAGTASTCQLSFSWNKVSGATGYQVYYCSVYDGTYKKIATVTSPSYTTGTALKTGTAYYYKVRALKGSATGAFSSILSTHTLTDKTTTLTTTGALNIRSQAGTSYSTLLTLPKSAKVTLVCKTKDKSGADWYRVQYTKGSATTTGYCAAKYLKTTTSSSSSSTKLAITTSGVNLRKSASGSSSVLIVVPKYTTLTVSSVSGNWYQVTYTKSNRNYSGYIYKDYLTVGTRAKVTSGTYIYSKTSTGSTKNKKLASGTRIVSLSSTKDSKGATWYKVKYTSGGKCFSGYCKGSLVQAY